MKLVPLKNETTGRLVFPDLKEMNFEVGETKRVSPAMLTHPSIARRLGKELSAPEQSEVVVPKVEEPKAPESPPSKPADIEPEPDEPIAVGEDSPADTEPEPDEPTAAVNDSSSDPEPEDETAGVSLREAFLAGPGITDANVDAILNVYPTKSALVEATKRNLNDLGVAKSFTKKLLAWARD